MKGREGHATWVTRSARPHPITTLVPRHAHDQHTRQTNTLFHTTQRERCQTQPGQAQKKRALSKTQAQREQNSDRKNGREREREKKKKGSPPTGQAETNSLKRPKSPGRCRASQSVARAVADAPMPKLSAVAAMLFLREALSSPSCLCHRQDCLPERVTRSGLAKGAHMDLTLRVCEVQSEEDLPRQC